MNRTKNVKMILAVLGSVILLVIVSTVFPRESLPKKCNYGNRACFDDGTIVPNLYLYSKEYVNEYFRQHKPEYSIGSIWSVESNPSRTYIYIREYLTKKGFLIFERGKVRLITENFEGHQALDDKGELTEIHYTKDSSSDNSHFLSDLSGEYFLSCNARMKNIEVRSVDDPNKPLTRSRLGAERIFCIDGKVYLFGTDESSFKGNGDTRDLVCQIFKKTGSGLEQQNEIRIPRPKAGPTPFYLEDIDPATKNIVLRDVRDWPSDSIYRLFNLDSRAMRTIYLPDGYAYPVFLREDILGMHSR